MPRRRAGSDNECSIDADNAPSSPSLLDKPSFTHSSPLTQHYHSINRSPISSLLLIVYATDPTNLPTPNHNMNQGGAIYNNGGSLTVADSTFDSNSAVTSSAFLF